MEEAKPTEKSFSLEKVKLTNGGIEVQYELTEVIGGDKCVNHYAVKKNVIPHPDLTSLLKVLKVNVIRIFHIAPEFEEDIDVKGIVVSGNGENIGIVISSIYTADNALSCALNTPRIKLVSNTFGFEKELWSLIEKIGTEVYLYLFEGKQAQLSLFGAENE